jgi:hypothetical protein
MILRIVVTTRQKAPMHESPNHTARFDKNPTKMSQVEMISSMPVKRLLQWSLCHGEWCLRVNPAYPRVSPAWTELDKGRYLQQVMNGTDISVLIVNITDSKAYIVDGAARVGVLLDFQQGRLSMVLTFQEMPDNVRFRPYGVPPEQYALDRFHYHEDTLVEASYLDLPADQQRAFLDAHVDIMKMSNLCLQDEQQLYWSNNCMCPSSPVYTCNYNETDAFEAVARWLSPRQVQSLLSVLNMLDGSVNADRVEVTRAAILRLTDSIIHDHTETGTASMSTSTSESDTRSFSETGEDMV